jgi:ribosomal protein L7/L12
MKSIRDLDLLTSIMNLIRDRSFDILCDIVDALLFNTGTVQSVLNKWGINLDAPATGHTANIMNIYCNGLTFNMTIRQYNGVMQCLYRDQKIDAIKAVRAATGHGLKESKEFTEYLIDNFKG